MPEVIDYDQLAADQERADEIACPGITARRKARRDADYLAIGAHYMFDEKYVSLVDEAIISGRPTAELFMLATLGKRSLADDIEERLALQRGGSSELDRLYKQRLQDKHSARERESDRAMEVFRFAGQQDSLPDDVMRSVISPPAANGPPVLDVCGRGVRLGQIDGQEVVVAVGKLA